MELKCAVVFTLANLLSVSATPHGYGVKGGAVARAEASAASGAFSGVTGLPLSIPSGPGFSGSFSKSSSSSFASSSASSSASSFSFSGSGAAGYGLNNLGTPGGCTGGCQSGHSASNGINDSNGSGSAGNNLQSISGVKSQTAVGAFAGAQGDSKDMAHGPCTNGICSGQKSSCEGVICKDTSEKCTSGQCGSNSPETLLPDRDHEDCASGQCAKDSDSASGTDSFNCKNGKCGDRKPTIPAEIGSNDNENCAPGQCSPRLPANSATENLGPNVKCTSGNCSGGTPMAIPGKDYNTNDIPISISSTSTSSHNYNSHLSDSHKTNAASQSPGADCKFGNCGSPSLTAKPYGYPGSNTYNPNQPQTAGPGGAPSHNKPATHLTAPKEEAPCTYPNCKEPILPTGRTPNLSPGTDCAGGYCDNGPINKYPSPNNGYSKPQNTQTPVGSPTLQCNSPNCYSGKEEPKPIKPSYGQRPLDQKGNDYPMSNCASGNCGYPSNSISSQPKIPDYTQGQSPSGSGNCASGNCGSYPSNQPNYDIQVSKIPTQTPGSNYSPNCASGNCDQSPIQPIGAGTLKPTIPSYSLKPMFSSYELNVNTVGSKQPTGPSNCAFGNCGNYPSSHTLDSSYPRLPSYPQSIQPDRPLNCASGNCPNYPSPHPGTGPTASKFPIASGNPSISSSSDCTSGNCGNGPVPQHGSFISSGFQSPSYPNKNCASGNCPNYPSPYPSTSPTESKFPIPSGQPPISSSPGCTSGNCGNSPASQHGSFGSSGFQNPSYATGNCASGNCPNYPSYPSTGSIGSKFPIPSGQLPTSNSPGCTSGNCGNSPAYQHENFGSSGFQSPSISGNKPVSNCDSGNCANYPSAQPGVAPNTEISHQPNGYTSSISNTDTNGQSPSGGPVPTGHCASGNCPSNPSTQLHQTPTLAPNSADKFPDYVALGVAGGATKPTYTGLFVHSSISSSQPNSGPNYSTSNSGTAEAAHSQTSALSSFKPHNDKEQIYTGGFGGPPGILKPYEFTAPSPNLPSSSSNKGSSHCSTGKCDAQSGNDNFSNKHDVSHGSDNFSNKHDVSHGTGPCTSGNCESQPEKPHYGQDNTASGAFAAAAAGSDAAVYTGGFGGPPGILKPYDDGKIGNIVAVTGAKHPDLLAGNNAHASGNKLNNDYAALSAASATANAGAFGSGSYSQNKAGCNSGCNSSGHGSFGGNIGSAGGISKSGLLDKLHNGAAASATSGAGASSFALGGSFASSSASAHSVAGSATKGGYGR